MANFPLISTDELLASDWELFRAMRVKPQVRTPFEGGAVQTRVRVTTARWKFQVGSRLMTTAQMNTLVAFFDTNQGSAFDLIHPITGATHEIQFSDDELPEFVPTGTGSDARWSVEGINLEETVGSVTVTQTTTTTTTSTTSTTTTTTTTSSSTTTTTTGP